MGGGYENIFPNRATLFFANLGFPRIAAEVSENKADGGIRILFQLSRSNMVILLRAPGCPRFQVRGRIVDLQRDDRDT